MVEVRYLVDVAEAISSKKNIIETLQGVGLLKRVVKCEKCDFGWMKKVVSNDRRITHGYKFRCNSCYKRCAITKGSVLYQCKTPLRNIIIILWYHAVLGAQVKHATLFQSPTQLR